MYSTSWLEEFSDADSIDILRTLALSHALEAGPIGERIADLVRRAHAKGPLKELVDFPLRYEPSDWLQDLDLDQADANSAHLRDVVAASRILHARQALAFFQKAEFLEIGVNKEESAWWKFIGSELLCDETNRLIKLRESGRFSFTPRVEAIVKKAQRKIARILGRLPRIGDLELRFGPGATRATKRREASVRSKMAETLQCSEELTQVVPYVLEEVPHIAAVHSKGLFETLDDFVAADPYGEGAVDVEEFLALRGEHPHQPRDSWDMVDVEITSALLCFVPKNAKTHRTVTVEPGINVMLQLGYGGYIARRLAAFGVDISDQTPNQRAAREGSMSGALATLDLSSASDTVARELVFLMLPLDWACALDRACTRKVETPAGVLYQRKFSAMGNGFTFALETLIFYAIASCASNHDPRVLAYGDDIVVPTEHVYGTVEALTALGFVVNEKKSYWHESQGPFRESCGKDYYRGFDVRPYYQKKLVSAQSLFVLHNHYVRNGDVERAKLVLNWIHPTLRIFGPDGYGDGHLLGEHPRTRPNHMTEKGYSGYLFKSFAGKVRKDESAIVGVEGAIPLYLIYRSAGEDSVPYSNKDGVARLPLPGVESYKKISIYTLG